MDFKLSYHWLQEFVGVTLTPDELAERLSLHSVSVERIHRMDEGLDAKVVIGRVERLERHPNADKLHVAVVTVQSAKGQKRGSAGAREVRVVCGGTNLREGMLVAFAPPGASVRWHGEGSPVVLTATEIRGVKSGGMICASSEIGLDAYLPAIDREILDLTNTLSSGAVGTPLARALGFDDMVLDVEVTTNRPDLMSIMGLAREVAAITGARLHETDRPSMVHAQHQRGSRGGAKRMAAQVSLRVNVEDHSRCPLYTGTVIDGVTVVPSPWWIQQRLLAGGIRPINGVVDVMNYVLLETGQPLHVFDAHRLNRTAGNGIGIDVRNARKGEKITALDGETYTLTPDMLTIADREGPVAVAGVIGGQESGVTARTTALVLEAATFAPAAVRAAWRTLDCRTESAIRYEKGVQPESVERARCRALRLLGELVGGTAEMPVIMGKTSIPIVSIPFRPADANTAIGIVVASKEMRRSLMALGCHVAGTGPSWKVTPPWWRRGDVAASFDLVEEVARIHGYHELPSVLPDGTLPAAVSPPASSMTMFDWEDRARNECSAIGATEFLTYSMTSQERIEASGYAVDQCVAIENPLTVDLSYLRPSIVTTLLPAIAENQSHEPHGFVFELGNVYIPGGRKNHGEAEEGKLRSRAAGLPREELRLTLARYGRFSGGDLVFELKGALEHCFARLGVRGTLFTRAQSCVLPSGVCMWHPSRTMDIAVGGILVGTIGELHPQLVAAFGIDQRVALADLDWGALLPAFGSSVRATSPPARPTAKRDLAVVLDRSTAYADVASVLAGFHPLLIAAELFDTYEDPTGTSIPMGKKSMAFHLTYAHPNRTLVAGEVEELHTALIRKIQERFAADVRV